MENFNISKAEASSLERSIVENSLLHPYSDTDLNFDLIGSEL